MGECLDDEYIDNLFEKTSGSGLDSIIVKVASGSNSGKGVQRIKVDSRDTLKSMFDGLQDKNISIQETIRQNRFVEQFNKSSVNILRVTSWRENGNVHIFSPVVRFGKEGNFTDVSFDDEGEKIQSVGVDIHTGCVSSKGVNFQGETIAPNIVEKAVPQWNNIIDTVKKAHIRMPYFDVIAWDITMDELEKIIFIEYNLWWPGTIIYQFAHGPMAGDDTDAFLSFLRNKESQKRLLPECIQL